MKKYDLSDVEERVKKGEKVRKIALEKKCCVSNIYTFLKARKIEIPKTNLIGRKWGYFEVIKKIGSKGKPGEQSMYWLCKCKCGNYRELNTTSIKKERQISCGCYITTAKYNERRWCWSDEITGEIRKKWWEAVKRNANKRNLEFSITIKEAWDQFILQNRKCSLSNMDIFFAQTSEENKNNFTTASLDRIDSSKGYIIGNIQWIHKDINIMKNNFNQEYFIQICKLISDNNSN